MRSRLLFRETGQVIRTRSSVMDKLQNLFGAAGIVALIGTLFLLGPWLDGYDEARAVSEWAVEAEAFEAGRQQGIDESMHKLSDAYSAGVQAGVDSVRDTPRGVALVQACLAVQALPKEVH